MAWHRTGDRPLSGLIMTAEHEAIHYLNQWELISMTHLCDTQPHCVENYQLHKKRCIVIDYSQQTQPFMHGQYKIGINWPFVLTPTNTLLTLNAINA